MYCKTNVLQYIQYYTNILTYKCIMFLYKLQCGIYMYYNIGIVRKNITNKYLYKSDINLVIGQLVIINFGTKNVIGIVLERIENTNYNGSIKEIKDILQYIIPQGYVKFIELFAKYNLISLGTALQLIIPFTIDNINKLPRKLNSIKSNTKTEVILNAEQKLAVDSIWSNINKFNTTLLHGITGSGKTEVFLEIVKRLVINGAQILILVPEIALSNSLAQLIASRCNMEVFIWHNSINITTKLYIWRKALNNEPIIVVGARSALFIPFTNLKFIVVDEEHELTFKQVNNPIYHARDMAVYLAYCLNIPIVLSSATPSMESYKNAIENKYNYVKLTSRFHINAKLPSIIINNMIGTSHQEIFSIETLNEINKYLKLKQQVLIFCNRRGYAPKRFCTKCGWKALCPACDTLLCYHCIDKVLRCHRCGYECTNINKCPKCCNPYLINMGIGIEKVYSECNRLFPSANIIMCSSDNMNTPNKIANIIHKITNNEVDIIIGTQILSKGHNFNNLNLVVIVDIDYMLYSEDFRALEHTFQLLNQVSGRAGRIGNIESKVIIQSYNPEALEIYNNSNQEVFYNKELNNRKLTNMPPYGYIASIEVSSKSETKALQFSEYMKDKLISIKKLFINENNKVSQNKNKEELQSNKNIKLENNEVLYGLETSNNKLYYSENTVLQANSSMQNRITGMKNNNDANNELYLSNNLGLEKDGKGLYSEILTVQHKITNETLQSISPIPNQIINKESNDTGVLFSTSTPQEKILDIKYNNKSPQFNFSTNNKINHIQDKDKSMNTEYNKITEDKVHISTNSKTTTYQSSVPAHNIDINKIKDIKIIGPIKPVLHKINYKYRYKILIMSKYPLANYINTAMSQTSSDRVVIQTSSDHAVRQTKKPSNINLLLDLNPYDFM